MRIPSQQAERRAGSSRDDSRESQHQQGQNKPGMRGYRNHFLLFPGGHGRWNSSISGFVQKVYKTDGWNRTTIRQPGRQKLCTELQNPEPGRKHRSRGNRSSSSALEAAELQRCGAALRSRASGPRSSAARGGGAARERLEAAAEGRNR